VIPKGVDSLDDNGELLGTLNSFVLNEDGALEEYESGT
jgi:hypothetical protein